MSELASTPPGAIAGDAAGLDLPVEFNAASYFIDRHLAEGRGENVAVIDDAGSYT